ncbi:hypothetical protein SORBI_3003G018150 [Sorghum bicolor]|uniref:Uncharacterized protein n=1 Tax=Sorghum bicolor TaxID=4558 RepID=A0A1B6Q0W4_SORBI|nr:hypothetical protein SORBI_3003G018150 [Sorghum bicolor]
MRGAAGAAAGRTLWHARHPPGWQRLRRRGRDGDDDDDGRHLGLLLGGGGGGCGADGGAAHGAGGVGAEPGVDAVGVEGVRALGQPPHLLPGLHLAEAYRAVERRRLRPVHERRQRGDRVRAHAVVAVRVAHPGREELAALTAAELAAAAAEVPDGEVEEEREDADGEGEAHEEQPRPGAVPRVVRREQPRVSSLRLLLGQRGAAAIYKAAGGRLGDRGFNDTRARGPLGERPGAGGVRSVSSTLVGLLRGSATACHRTSAACGEIFEGRGHGPRVCLVLDRTERDESDDGTPSRPRQRKASATKGSLTGPGSPGLSSSTATELPLNWRLPGAAGSIGAFIRFSIVSELDTAACMHS